MDRYTVGQVVGTVDCHYCGKTHVAEFSYYSQWGENMPVFSVVCFNGKAWVTDHYTTDAVRFNTEKCQGCGKEIVEQHMKSHAEVCEGEETVNDMTTGEAAESREMFPRVTFREIADAELVAGSLTQTITEAVKNVAQAFKLLHMAEHINAIAPFGVSATVLGRDSEPADVHAVITDIIAKLVHAVETLEAVILQIAKMHSESRVEIEIAAEQAKRVSRYMEFVSDTREIIDQCSKTADEMKKGE